MKPRMQESKQRLIKYVCRDCNIYFKIDMHDSFDSVKIRKMRVHCPLCLKEAEKLGA